MTSFAGTSPPLRRLFEKLDSAPHPTINAISEVLDAWLAARGSSVYPTPDDRTIEELLRTNASTFVFRRAPGSLDWAPVAIAPKLRHLLGPEAPIGPDLARRRIAVRLRRLFEAVSLAGEPLEAHFGQTEHGTRTAEIEVLVAPLSSDGSTVNCILGSLDISPCAPSPGRLHLHQAPSAHLPMLFALGSSKAMGEAVATCLGVELSPCEERSFEDGEHKSRSLVDVRGRDVCVLHSLHGDSSQSANDKLCRTLFFVGSLKDAGARHVSVLAPYLCYSRKDRITKARDPVTTRYVARLFEAVGTDHLATVDVHNPAAFQNAFRCDTDHVEAASLFVDELVRTGADGGLAVVSPDAGGMKRAEALREALEERLRVPVSKGFMEKQRSLGKVTGSLFAGDVRGRVAVIVDDMISTGGTMVRAAIACRQHGAKGVMCMATHGLFGAGAEALLGSEAVDRVVVTDTVAIQAGLAGRFPGRLSVLPIAPLLASAIREWSAG